MKRHTRIDLRTLHNADLSEGTRAVLLAQPSEMRDLPAAAPYARPAADDQRRHRGARRPA